MIPGEYLLDGAPLELNAGRETRTVEVNNTGDRPVQVGSHYHFFEVNKALVFDRAAAYGMRLDVPAGTAVRIEPGEIKTVQLVAMAGERIVFGGSGLVNGALDQEKVKQGAMDRLERWTRGELALGPIRAKSDAKPRKPKKFKKLKKSKR
jgi:urease subunit beta